MHHHIKVNIFITFFKIVICSVFQIATWTPLWMYSRCGAHTNNHIYIISSTKKCTTWCLVMNWKQFCNHIHRSQSLSHMHTYLSLESLNHLRSIIETSGAAVPQHEFCYNYTVSVAGCNTHNFYTTFKDMLVGKTVQRGFTVHAAYIEVTLNILAVLSSDICLPEGTLNVNTKRYNES